MKVLKFGGTSVGSVEAIRSVEQIITKASKSEDVLAVVVSAFGGITDMLVSAANKAFEQDTIYKETLKKIQDRHLKVIKALIPATDQSRVVSRFKQDFNKLEMILEGIFLLEELSPKTLDKVVSNGELFSFAIIGVYFQCQGIDVVVKDSRELIQTDDNHSCAEVRFPETNRRTVEFFKKNKHKVVMLPGFVGATENGVTTTLGRGGSDFTGAIIAAVMEVSKFEIWTDVSGIYTANPKIVKGAKPQGELSYLEVMELSHFGAKVVYPPTIQPILDKKIPMCIKNTFAPDDKGSLVVKSSKSKTPVRGITHIDKMSLLIFEGSGLIGIPGVSERFFGVLAKEKINIVLITQASSEHSICVCVHQRDAERAQKSLDKAFEREIAIKKLESCKVKDHMAILAIVGDNMKNHQGISGRVFGELGKNNVNIKAIAQGASERNISTVIEQKDAYKALNVLHECFFEDNIKPINLFITGIGNVGEKLIEQIRSQSEYLRDHLKVNPRVIALSNSRKMYFEREGIDLDNWEKLLDEKGEPADGRKFLKGVEKLNLRNSIFVDNTASSEISEIYADYLRQSISVVTCNKIACSSSMEHYKRIKMLSRKFGASLMFETNVGAALPIINTLNDLITSGDEIREIQAVLSGSLNFVFNNYDGSRPFHEVVRQAKDEGYTEPDPGIDLSGVDVTRKILILVRESGFEMNMEDIDNDSFLPRDSKDADTVEAFFTSLAKNEKHFRKILDKATSKDCRLKYVASFKDGKASVGLKEISYDHPFYNLEGKDNIVLFFTKRYDEQPLLIKGAGAGADITASGVFSDIIRSGNS